MKITYEQHNERIPRHRIYRHKDTLTRLYLVDSHRPDLYAVAFDLNSGWIGPSTLSNSQVQSFHILVPGNATVTLTYEQ